MEREKKQHQKAGKESERATSRKEGSRDNPIDQSGLKERGDRRQIALDRKISRAVTVTVTSVD